MTKRVHGRRAIAGLRWHQEKIRLTVLYSTNAVFLDYLAYTVKPTPAEPTSQNAFTLLQAMTAYVLQDENNKCDGGVHHETGCLQPVLLSKFSVISSRPP